MNQIISACLLLGASGLAWFGCSSAGDGDVSSGQLALDEAGTDLEGDGLCAAVAQIDVDCPPDLAWDNHGQYVSCVAKYLSARVEAGDVSEEHKGALVAAAAHSPVGKHGRGEAKVKDERRGGDDDAPDAGGGAGSEGAGGAGGVAGGSPGDSSYAGSGGSDTSAQPSEDAAVADDGGEPDASHWAGVIGAGCP